MNVFQLLGINTLNHWKPSGYFTYHQVLHHTHILYMCCAWISEETVTFALCNRFALYYRGEPCLLHSMQW